MSSHKTIPLTQGYFAIVDAADYDHLVSLGAWCVVRPHKDSRNVYAVRRMHREGSSNLVRMHTYLTGWKMVDHINGNGLDNRRENLRPTDKQRNGLTSRLSKRNKSGYKGVRQLSNGRWTATLSGVHLGTFGTPELAAEAYRQASVRLFGSDEVLLSTLHAPGALPVTNA